MLAQEGHGIFKKVPTSLFPHPTSGKRKTTCLPRPGLRQAQPTAHPAVSANPHVCPGPGFGGRRKPVCLPRAGLRQAQPTKTRSLSLSKAVAENLAGLSASSASSIFENTIAGRLGILPELIIDNPLIPLYNQKVIVCSRLNGLAKAGKKLAIQLRAIRLASLEG